MAIDKNVPIPTEIASYFQKGPLGPILLALETNVSKIKFNFQQYTGKIQHLESALGPTTLHLVATKFHKLYCRILVIGISPHLLASSFLNVAVMNPFCPSLICLLSKNTNCH